MRILKSTFLFLAMAAIIGGCKKAETTTGPKPGGGGTNTIVYYLVSERYTNANQDSIVYTRNSSHIVTERAVYNTAGERQSYKTYTYDGSKLSKVTYLSGTGDVTGYASYEYAVSGSNTNVTVKVYQGSTETSEIKYELGAYFKPKTASYYTIDMSTGTPTPALVNKVVYTYEAAGNNITKTEAYDATNALMGSTTYSYDTRASAYGNMPAEDYSVATRSKNNIKGIQNFDASGSPAGDVHYTYTYNSSNYPTSAIDAGNNGILFTYTK